MKSSHSPNPEQIVYPRKTTRDSVANQNLFEDESTIEEQEESHILEDIFFLKWYSDNIDYMIITTKI